MNNTKYENRYIQFIRGILICIVIFIHCMSQSESIFINNLNIIIRSIINVGVPIFVILAGYFTKKEKVILNTKDYIVRRLKRLLIPLIIYSALYCLIRVFTDKYNLIDCIYRFITFSSVPHLYYIVVLLQLTLITPYIVKHENNKILMRALYFITPLYYIILGICEIFLNIDIPLYQYFFFGWIIYYLIGLRLQENKIKNFPKKQIILIIFTLTLSIVTNLSIYNIDNKTYSYATSQLNIFNLLYVLSIVPLLIYLKKIYRKNMLTNFIEQIGDYSFSIYLIHYAIIILLKKIVEPNNFNFIFNYLILFGLTLIISYLISKLLNKIIYYKTMIRRQK